MPEFEDDRLGVLFGLSKGSTPPAPASTLPHTSRSTRSEQHRNGRSGRPRDGEASPRRAEHHNSHHHHHDDKGSRNSNEDGVKDAREEDIDPAYASAYARIKREKKKSKFKFKEPSSRSSRADEERRERAREEDRHRTLYGADEDLLGNGEGAWYESKSKRRKITPEGLDEDDDMLKAETEGVHIPARHRREKDSAREKDHHRSDRHRSSHRSHRSSRRHRHRSDRDDYNPENDPSYAPPNANFDPDDAFRQSLFDAMADDEGAAFWESVYGQPLHTYPRPPAEANEKGELEAMTDEEYAAYVRQKMWEKSHEHILEERARREKEREARKERDREEAREWERRERERLHREKERRTRKQRATMGDRWNQYTLQWQEVLATEDKDGVEPPWPVESGRLEDVEKKNVEEFFLKGVKEGELEGVFKMERVRWHPDKMQQRLGTLEKVVLEGVTAVFQTVDAMWGELREKK